MRDVLCFGEIASGKSTVAATVCHFLLKQNAVTPRLNIRNPSGLRILFDHWINRIDAGLFPHLTPADKIERIDLGLDGLPKRAPAGLSFFEIAGETIRNLDVLRSFDEKIEVLRPVLQSADDILLVGPAEPSSDEDQMFKRFLELVAYLDPAPRVALVMSKWDETGRPSEEAGALARDNYSLSSQHIEGVYKSEIVFPFSVGEVERGDEDSAPRIANLDYDAGARQLAEWLLGVRGTQI